MKKVSLILTGILIGSLLSTAAFSATQKIWEAKQADFSVYVNGYKKSFSDPIVTINDKTYIPLRETANALDATVNWDESNQKININTVKAASGSDLIPFKDEKTYQYGYKDADGNIVIPAKYEYAGEFSDGLAVVSTLVNGFAMSGYIDKTGKLVIPCKFEQAADFVDGIAAVDVSDYSVVMPDGRMGKRSDLDDYTFAYIDKTGTIIQNKTFHDVYWFSEGYGAVLVEGTIHPEDEYKQKWKFVDTNLNFASDMTFEAVKSFHGGFAAVKNNGKWGLINKSFKLVVDYQYDTPEELLGTN